MAERRDAEGKNKVLSTLISAGALKAPLKLEKVYRGEKITGRVESDGTVSFAGKSYPTPSAAGAAARAAILKTKKLPATNGWDFWSFRDQAGNLQPLGSLRKKVPGVVVKSRSVRFHRG